MVGVFIHWIDDAGVAFVLDFRLVGYSKLFQLLNTGLRDARHLFAGLFVAAGWAPDPICYWLIYFSMVVLVL